jgi:hypothetical protein
VPRARSRIRSVWIGGVAACALHAQQADSGLRNSSVLPLDAAAAARLEQGDLALRAARAARAGEVADWDAVFEAWHAALADAPAAAVVPGFRVTASAGFEPLRERSDGIASAVLARLLALEPARRAQWSQRFEPLAAGRLAASGYVRSATTPSVAPSAAPSAAQDRRQLARLLRDEPLCGAALRAGLLGVDLAGADGATAEAHALALEVERQALALSDTQPELAALAQAARRRADQFGHALDLQPAAATAAAAEWERGRLRLVSARAIAPPGRSAIWDPAEIEAGLARGLHAGIAADLGAAAGGRVVLQTPAAIWWGQSDLSDLRGFAPRELLREVLPDLGPEYGARAAPGWTLSPSLRGRRLWVVVGRSLDGYAPNALACIDLPDPDSAGALAPALPQLRWMRSGAQHCDARLDRSGFGPADPLLAELDNAEFQAPALPYGDLLLVRARSRAADARQWLLALDAASGALRWICATAQGAFLMHEDPRLRLIDSAADRASRTGAAGPLWIAAGRVFDGTQLGLGSLVRIHDGALVVAQRYHRRATAASESEELGGSTGAAARVGERRWAWFPADADRPGIWQFDFPATGALEVLREPTRALLRLDDATAHLAEPQSGLPSVPRFDPGARVALLGASESALWLLWEQTERWRALGLRVPTEAQAGSTPGALADTAADAATADTGWPAAAPLYASFERVPPRAEVGAAIGGVRRCVISDGDGLWILDASAELRLEHFLNWEQCLAGARERVPGPFIARPAALQAAGPWLWVATPTHWLVFRSES